jgi:hypothetical protein
MNNNMFQGDIDPDLAALLGVSSSQSKPSEAITTPNYKDLFGTEDIETPNEIEVDLTQNSFPEITKPYATIPLTVFSDPDYYKKALSGEGDIAQRVHTILQKFLTTKDPKDRGVFRQQLTTAYWDFLLGIARKTPGKIPDNKKFLLRYGILHPGLLAPEDRDLFSKIIVDNELNQPIYYLDEWFKAIGTGVIKNSTTDEVRVAKNNEATRLKQLLEKAEGRRDAARNLLKAKSDERASYEKALFSAVQIIAQHSPIPGFPDLQSVYTEVQKRAFSEIQELLKNMAKADRELDSFLKEFSQAQADVQILEDKVREAGADIAVDIKAIDTEFDSVRQMVKLTIGRQGNHFPILVKEYFHCGPNEIATRENVIKQLAWVESIDPEAFCRVYKNKLNRIVPYVILVPSYGEFGICWEPFDRFNRATSRGRIAIPLYPKNLTLAILSAVGDLRWQNAKEKASYYWMEEGITGNYYQWFTSKKLKGDVKEYFIQDYILWMTKESEGIQKLDKEVRGIFWRYIPFSQSIKDKLKGRSYIYQELYQRDINRSLSDGY